MVTFLSDAWIDALDAAACADDRLATATAGLAFSVEQEVLGGPAGDVRYHVVFDHGAVSVRPGPLPGATVRFSVDHETASAIASGQGSAQRAFMAGRLRVGGDLRVLLEHGEVLGQLDDVFAEVRARTDALGGQRD
jgi:putative sterol carrier protein